MKKYSILFVALFCFSFFSSSLAQDRGLGIGLIFGEPTGFSGKYWLDDKNAVDAGFGYSLISGSKEMSLHVDYLYHTISSIKLDNQQLPIYYGFGGRLRIKENASDRLGVRGVIGAIYKIKSAPVEIFLEVAPVFTLLPETDLDFDFGLGGRYYFDLH